MWVRITALLAALALAGAAWAQKGLPTNSVPYSGGAGTQGWLSVGPCSANQAVGYAVTGGTPGCVGISGGSGGGGGGGSGIPGITAGTPPSAGTPTQGFLTGDIIGSSGGFVYDTGVSPGNLGTVQDIFAACASTTINGPITSIGTIAIVDLEGLTFTSNGTVVAANCGYTIRLSSATPFTVTIPQAGTTGFGAGTYFDFCNYASGNVVLSASSGTIGGASSVTANGATVSTPYCLRVLYSAASAWDVKFVTPTLAISNISAGTTAVGNCPSGQFLYAASGVLQCQAANFTLSAGITGASGFGTNDVVSVSGGLVRDSGVPYTNIGLLPANQTWSGSDTFSGTLNVSGTFQWHSTTYTFPAATDQVAGLSAGNAFTGNDSFAGVTTWTGSLKVKVRTVSGTITVSATTDYFLCVDTTSTPATVNLPAGATGLTYLVKDCVGTGNAGTNNITINPASGNIDGATSAVISTNGQSLAITYTGTQWSIN